MTTKPVKKYLYDTTYYDEPELYKFIPVEKRDYYTKGEIFGSFEEAKKTVVNALEGRLKALQEDLEEVKAITLENCPIRGDPYFS